MDRRFLVVVVADAQWIYYTLYSQSIAFIDTYKWFSFHLYVHRECSAYYIKLITQVISFYTWLYQLNEIEYGDLGNYQLRTRLGTLIVIDHDRKLAGWIKSK